MKKCLTLVLLLGLALPTSAYAIRCSEWTRLGQAGREEAIYRMIESGAQGSRRKKYTSINLGRTLRCLEQNMTNIAYDFDGACADRRTGLQGLNDIFKRYAWGCVE